MDRQGVYGACKSQCRSALRVQSGMPHTCRHRVGTPPRLVHRDTRLSYDDWSNHWLDTR